MWTTRYPKLVVLRRPEFQMNFPSRFPIFHYAVTNFLTVNLKGIAIILPSCSELDKTSTGLDNRRPFESNILKEDMPWFTIMLSKIGFLSRYTRNLVDEGNGKFNLMALCWGEGQGSSIHDHTNSHCFVKVLDGQLMETMFSWPSDSEDETAMQKLSSETYNKDQCAYICGEWRYVLLLLFSSFFVWL